MEKLECNQFQGLYELTDVYYRIDFLENKIQSFPKATYKPVFQFNAKYEQISCRIDEIVSKKNSDILPITVITDFSCNMKCSYCYEKMILPTTGKISIDSIRNFVLWALEQKQYNHIAVSILGGEPLMPHNIVFIDQLIHTIQSLNVDCSFSIVTNGLNVVKYIKNILMWGISGVQITLDGIEDVQNARRVPIENVNGFQTIAAGISQLLKNDVEVSLRINVDRNNVERLPELLEFISRQGWCDQKLHPYIYPITKSGCQSYPVLDSETEILKMVLNTIENCDDSIIKLFRLDFHGVEYIDSIVQGKTPNIKFRFCGISEQFVIANDGEIYSCWWGINEVPFHIGTIADNVKNYDRELSIMKNRTIANMENCKKCKYRFVCGGGCTYTEWFQKHTVENGNCSNFDTIIKYYLQFLRSKAVI